MTISRELVRSYAGSVCELEARSDTGGIQRLSSPGTSEPDRRIPKPLLFFLIKRGIAVLPLR